MSYTCAARQALGPFARGWRTVPQRAALSALRPALGSAWPASLRGAGPPRPFAEASTGRCFAAAVAQARDPEKPRKPATPWLRYLQHFRQQKPEVKHAEVMKSAGIEWKTLTDSQRQPFVGPFEAERERYQAAFKEYVDSGKKAAWSRDPEKPKRPITAYMIYAQEVREAKKSLKVTEQMKLAGEGWRALAPEGKRPYEAKAASLKTAYEDAMKKYQASGKEDAWKEKVGLNKKDQEKATLAAKTKLAKEKAKLDKARDKAKIAQAKMKMKLAKDKEKAKLAKAREKAKSVSAKAKAKATDNARTKVKAEGEREHGIAEGKGAIGHSVAECKGSEGESNPKAEKTM